ncbi:O-antigen ligase family protein [Vibrio vulnificus]|nr:O-antigen ligase family protein [Vibrio vulnificus]ELS3556116.1 O-antigen ligase family protein [Vibrio vulnificus]ELS9098783.1 O-antigen ligase family protein [Vibrio vulnificus]
MALYPLLLVSGIITGFLSYLGMSYILMILILLVSVYSITNYNYNKKDIYWILGAISVFFLTFFSLLYSDSIEASKEKILQLFLTFLSFICGLNCARRYELEKILNISIAYVSIINAIYIYVFFGVAGGDLSAFKALSNQQDSRIIADYLLLSIIVYPLLYLKLFTGKKDVFFVLIFFSSLFCVSLGGRGPLIALIIIILIPTLLMLRKYIKFLLLGILLAVFLVLYTGTFDTILARFDSIGSGGGDISLQIRFSEYERAVDSISKNIILGSGVGMSGLILGYGDVYAYPHNILLESWMELGIIGLILVLLLYFYASTNWILTKSSNPAFWLGLVVLFYLINALKTGSIYEQRYLFFYLGMNIFYMKHSHNVCLNNKH